MTTNNTGSDQGGELLAAQGAVEWRCYHCGDVFTDDRCARLHFGRDEDSQPACQIKAGAEQGLLSALRDAEYAAADAQQAIANECTEAAKAYYAQATRHQQALRNAEELGYERGLSDGRAHPPERIRELEEEVHVFLDCDGVLADFDTHAEAYFGMPARAYEKQMGSAKFWAELEAKGDFYRSLPLTPDAMALYEGVKHLHPTILTGCPRGNWAQGQKVAWAAEHFPGVPIITCRSADKRDYAKAGDVIIDDWPQHRHRWIEMGGVFIVHHDAASSLAALWAHYPRLSAVRSLSPNAGEGR